MTRPKPEHQAKVSERRRAAFELRVAGYGFEQIGRELGCSKSTAFALVTAALKPVSNQQLETYRALELERLDRLQRALWPLAIGGQWQATDRILRILERRAALLGLDRPREFSLRHYLDERGAALAEELGLEPTELVRLAEQIVKGHA